MLHLLRSFYFVVAATSCGLSSSHLGDESAIDGEDSEQEPMVYIQMSSFDPGNAKPYFGKATFDVSVSLVHESFKGSVGDEEISLISQKALSSEDLSGHILSLKRENIGKAMEIYARRRNYKDDLNVLHFGLRVAITQPNFFGSTLNCGSYVLQIGSINKSYLPIVREVSRPKVIENVALEFEESQSYRKDRTATVAIAAFATDAKLDDRELAFLK